MAADLGPAWIGLIGVVAGAFVAGLFGWLTLRATLQGQREDREHRERLAREERDAAVRLAMRTFQADTLIELQLAVARYVRSCGAIQYEDEARFHDDPSAGYGKTPMGESSSDEHYQIRVVLGLLAHRVADDDLPSLVSEFSQAGTRVISARDLEPARAALSDMASTREEVDAAIARLLREMPAPSGPIPLVISPVNFDAHRQPPNASPGAPA